MRVPLTILALLGLSADASAACLPSISIVDFLTCSSAVSGQVTGFDASNLGGSGINSYTCGDPYAPLPQTGGEDVYAFECQVSGDVTLEVSGMDCDLDIYVLDDTCDPFGGCVDGSTDLSVFNDEVVFTCIEGDVYYIVIEAYGWTVGPGDPSYCASGEGNYTLEFDVSESTGCPEDCDNGEDDDLDGDYDCDDSDCAAEEYCCDADDDGYLADRAGCLGGDCDDEDASVYPGADEYCNEVDDDCDSLVDEDPLDGDDFYTDVDSDGYGDPGSSREACEAPSNHVDNDDDCDDSDRTIFPGASETCDGIDQDCDVTVDEDAIDGLNFYADSDGDSYGDPDAGVVACSSPSDHVASFTDCDDGDAAIHPGADEYCNEDDDDCDAVIDEDALDVSTWYHDADSDGYGDPADAEDACEAPADHLSDNTDCHDANRLIYPGAEETPYDGVDQDCDGFDLTDVDEDGYDAEIVGGTDCNDLDPDTWPGASETEGGTDQDCDDRVDEGTDAYDDDLDGYTEYGGDCDDGDGGANPAAIEECDDQDDDCDGIVDEDTECSDDDGDGYSELDDDCNDADIDVNPGAEEILDNGVDDDCNGQVDNGVFDGDEDGYVGDSGDCDEENADTYPGAPELSDGEDNDCDGTIDEGTPSYDDDNDGASEDDGDCDDSDDAVAPGAPEEVNGVDDDCDGAVDEGGPTSDDDGDGFSEEGGDCDDEDAGAFPGAPETDNGDDDDCDDQIDEGTDDLDGDGWTASQGDCDDDDGWANPDREEVCDGVDNDCDLAIDEGDCADLEGAGLEEGDKAACGCASSGAAGGSRAPGGALILLTALSALRRRRR